jgi:hypothetical protein
MKNAPVLDVVLVIIVRTAETPDGQREKGNRGPLIVQRVETPNGQKGRGNTREKRKAALKPQTRKLIDKYLIPLAIGVLGNVLAWLMCEHVLKDAELPKYLIPPFIF